MHQYQRQIIEIKARCEKPEAIRHKLLDKGADFIGLDHQIDTYFKVPQGRLKLRQGNIENTLIHYRRSNLAGPKKSEVLLYKPVDGAPLKDILAAALGVLTVVDKQRDIFFIDNVKFHIDQVKQLGNFVEIEAIGKDESIGEDRLHEQCNHYLDYLDIRQKDLVRESYSDLIIS